MGHIHNDLKSIPWSEYNVYLYVAPRGYEMRPTLVIRRPISRFKRQYIIKRETVGTVSIKLRNTEEAGQGGFYAPGT